MADIVHSLEAAANTIYEIQRDERRRLIDTGIEAVNDLRGHLFHKGDVLPINSGFMSDMPVLAEMAGQDDAAEVRVGAGMLTLAGEMARLRALAQDMETIVYRLLKHVSN